MTNGGAFSHRKLSNLSGSPDDTNSSHWATARIDKLLGARMNDGVALNDRTNSSFNNTDLQ